MAESEEKLKSLLMKVKEESEKIGLKLNIKKAKIMASGPIISWQIDGETVETWLTIFLGSKITADGDCSHEIKRCLLLGRKVMTNLDRILQSKIDVSQNPQSIYFNFPSLSDDKISKSYLHIFGQLYCYEIYKRKFYLLKHTFQEVFGKFTEL